MIKYYNNEYKSICLDDRVKKNGQDLTINLIEYLHPLLQKYWMSSNNAVIFNTTNQKVKLV